MARAKIKRNSTRVDMTAMCDVAFLLLTFFILTGQFKPAEAVQVVPPSSVSNTHPVEKHAFEVTIDKDNRIFLSLSDDIKDEVWDELVKEKDLKTTSEDKKDFHNTDFVGVPFSQLLQFIKIPADQRKNVKMDGIPTDSTDNELQAWITAAVTATQGERVDWLIKADGDTKYPTFGKVIDAFEKNDQYKYNLITNSRAIPEGTPFYEDNLKAQHGGK